MWRKCEQWGVLLYRVGGGELTDFSKREIQRVGKKKHYAQ